MCEIIYLVIVSIGFFLLMIAVSKILDKIEFDTAMKTSPIIKKTKRADEQPVCAGPYKRGKWKWSDTPCESCHSFDGYDVCRHPEHWGTVTEQTLNLCYKRRLEAGEIVENKKYKRI